MSNLITPAQASEILKGEPISNLVVAYDVSKATNLHKSLFMVKNLIEEIKKEWEKHFESELSNKDLEVLFSDTELFLKDRYISVHGFDKQLNMIKRNKLIDIVDFPDFSEITNAVENIKNAFDYSLSRFMKFEAVLSLSIGSDEEIEKEIESICSVKIEGWERIKKFLAFILFVDGLNGLMGNRSVKDIIPWAVRNKVIIETYRSYHLDMIVLAQSIDNV